MDFGTFHHKIATITVPDFMKFWYVLWHFTILMRNVVLKVFTFFHRIIVLIRQDFQGEAISESVVESMLLSDYGTLSPLSDENKSSGGLFAGKKAAKKITDPDIQITYKMWASILDSLRNDLFDPAKSSLYMDMTQPLPNYFIASSYNTFLEGDQLTSPSTVTRYITDLLSGVRAIELNCVDGQSIPEVSHGHTLTGRIAFRGNYCRMFLSIVKNFNFTFYFHLCMSYRCHKSCQGLCLSDKSISCYYYSKEPML